MRRCENGKLNKEMNFVFEDAHDLDNMTSLGPADRRRKSKQQNRDCLRSLPTDFARQLIWFSCQTPELSWPVVKCAFIPSSLKGMCSAHTSRAMKPSL